MQDWIIDFRSDTVTKPTPGMQEAMQKAVVGDDVFGEDPSINALEKKTAELFGMQAAIFLSFGHHDKPDSHQMPHPTWR